MVHPMYAPKSNEIEPYMQSLYSMFIVLLAMVKLLNEE